MDKKEKKDEKETNNKSFSKVDNKEKKENLFSNVEHKPKDTKTKVKNEEVVKGTVTVEKGAIKTDKKNNKNKVGKWIATIVVIVLLVAVLVGVLFFLKTPYFAVMKTFNAIKSGNISTANQFMSYDSLMNSLAEGLNGGENMSELEKNCFNSFEFKINTVNIEGDKAIVNVDTTNKNFRNAITKLTQTFYQKFISGEDISNEEGIELLNACLSDSSIGTMSVNNDITLNKVDGKWQIEMNSSLQDAIFPGLSEVINSLNTLTTEQ